MIKMDIVLIQEIENIKMVSQMIAILKRNSTWNKKRRVIAIFW